MNVESAILQSYFYLNVNVHFIFISSYPGPEHLPNYHEWMQDTALLDATGSEPLTMEQEIEMQREWRDDDKKCTFIILARDLLQSNESSDGDLDISIPGLPSDERCNNDYQETPYPNLVEQTLHLMIGDINLFLSEEEEDSDGYDFPITSRCQDGMQSNKRQELSQAELDVMIAKQSHRHKGLGTELVLIMMHYGASMLGIRRFFVKIKNTNTSSLKLFREKLEFVECAYAECFGEYELECKHETADDMVMWVKDKWERCCLHKNRTQTKLYDIYKCPLS